MVVHITFNFVGEKHQVAGYTLKYISYIISNFQSTGVAFDDYPENLPTTDKTHKCYFKAKNDAFLRNTANEHSVIVILTELKKPGCNTFHLYDGADIDIKS